MIFTRNEAGELTAAPAPEDEALVVWAVRSFDRWQYQGRAGTEGLYVTEAAAEAAAAAMRHEERVRDGALDVPDYDPSEVYYVESVEVQS